MCYISVDNLKKIILRYDILNEINLLMNYKSVVGFKFDV